LLIFWLVLKLGPNVWWGVALVDKPIMSADWGEPQSLNFNTGDWESSANISSDGNTLLFSFYPGDLSQALATGKLIDDLDVYYSVSPFIKAEKHTLSEDQWSEIGAIISESDIYYAANRNHLDNYDIYKNGQVIINTLNKSEKDPHYCAAQAELYFEVDGYIYVNKNNQTTALPFPINDESRNLQPFLTPDCQIIYFTSTRGDGLFKILRSQRSGENFWSEPELVASSRYGVGEPSLTADGQRLFFVQILKSAKETINADIFYVDKLEK